MYVDINKPGFSKYLSMLVEIKPILKECVWVNKVGEAFKVIKLLLKYYITQRLNMQV